MRLSESLRRNVFDATSSSIFNKFKIKKRRDVLFFENILAEYIKECEAAGYEKEMVDVILVDTMMPDMSGWEVLNKIREKRKEQKVVFMSDICISNDRERNLFENGLTGYITKPFTKNMLIDKVNDVFRNQ